jgi:hypothetical protein
MRESIIKNDLFSKNLKRVEYEALLKEISSERTAPQNPQDSSYRR